MHVLCVLFLEEDILKHIQMKFDPHLEYVCISLLKWNPSVVFIQIILQKVINKKTYFLNSVAGLHEYMILGPIHRYILIYIICF